MLKINLKTRKLRRGGCFTQLTQREIDVFMLLLRRGDTVSCVDIETLMYDRDKPEDTKSVIRATVSTIRRKLEDVKFKYRLKAIYKNGYRLTTYEDWGLR